MTKQHIIYLVVGAVILMIAAGGWYIFKTRECLKDISYVPPREGSAYNPNLSGFYGRSRTQDKGDYYRFDFREFRTSEDAMRACIWK